MSDIDNITVERWSSLLNGWSQADYNLPAGEGKIIHKEGRRTIEVKGQILNEKDIVAITCEKVEEKTSYCYHGPRTYTQETKINYHLLDKIIRAIQQHISNEKTTQKNDLQSYSARFSRWAKNHSTLAKILSFFTLGFLDRLKKKGDVINEKADTLIEFQILEKQLTFKLENKKRKPQKLLTNGIVQEEKELEPTSHAAYPPVIQGLILEYLSKEDRAIALQSEPLQQVMEEAEGYKWKLVDYYQQQVMDALNPLEHSKEIEHLKTLKDQLEADDDFMMLEVDSSKKEKIILEKIFTPLRLDYWDTRQAPPQYTLDLMKIRIIALIAVKTSSGLLQYLPDSLKNDKEIVLAAVKQNCFAFQYASANLRNDKEVVLTAIRNDFFTDFILQHGSEALQNDKEIVLEAVKRNGKALKHASPNLKNDREVVLASLTRSGTGSLEDVSETLKNDKEIVLAFATGRPRKPSEHFSRKQGVLQHASETLKNDRAFVLEVLKVDGRSLLYLPDHLKQDRELLITAFKQDKYILEQAPEEMKNDKELVLISMSQYPFLGKVSATLQDDEEVVLAAVKKGGLSLRHASERLRNKKEIVLAAIQNSGEDDLRRGEALEFASENLRDDKEVVLAAVNKWPYALKFASERLKRDRDVVLAAVKLSGRTLYYVKNYFGGDKEVVLAAVNSYGKALGCASARLRNNREVVLAAVRNMGRALGSASDSLKNDLEIVHEAVKSSPQIKLDKLKTSQLKPLY